MWNSIDMIEGISDFPMHRSSPKRKQTDTPSVYVVPQSLQSLYNMSKEDISGSVTQAPAEFQDDAS